MPTENPCKRVEGELAVARRRYAEAQEVAHVGSFEWDIATNVVSWSDELYRICGVEEEQFIGTYEMFLSHVHPDDRELTEKVVVEAFHNPAPFEYDHRIVRPDGGIRFLRTKGSVIVDEAGKAIRMVGSCWDTTALEEATRDLERTISLLEATFDATADGILVVDRDGAIVAYNRPFLAMWRIPGQLARCLKDDALLAFVLDQLEDPEGFVDRVRDLYRKPEQESLDTLLFKDGRVFQRYSAPRRLGRDPIGRVWSFRDVTSREQALRRAHDALGALAVVAHDIRNPLGALSLQVDLMKRTLLAENPSLKSLGKQLIGCQKLVDRAAALLSCVVETAESGENRVSQVVASAASPCRRW